jgi:hypothetical membrane protein
MERLGPLVRPEVRRGGALLVIGSLQFIVAMVIAQLAYPHYSDLSNYISDLGAHTATASSPLAWLFNGSICLLGVLGIVGTYLIRTAFPNRTTARAGLGCLMVAEVTAFLVGVFPEQTPHNVHAIVSSVTFVFAGLALLILGFAMFRDTRWDGYRGYTFLSGVVTFAAIALFQANVGGAGYQGLLERIVVAPILLWAILAGLHLGQMPTFAPAKVTARSD